MPHGSPIALQQLLKMREELKQREAELEKSLEDKQQLKNQVQTLKEGLHNLQNTQKMQVSLTENTHLNAEVTENKAKERIYCIFLVCFMEFILGVILFESEQKRICTLIRKNDFKVRMEHCMEDIREINHQ